MKTFGIFVAAILIPAAAFADAVISAGASFVSVPVNFQSTTGSNGGLSTPFWNNNSMDGTNMNAGDFLTGSNASLGLTDYLSTGVGYGNYLSTGASGLDAPTNFNLLHSGLTVDVSLLYTNAMANMTTTYGTQIGFYNVADPNQKTVLFAHGTLFNPNASDGVYNANQGSLGTSTVSTYLNYGIYAQTCGFNAGGGIYCDTYYSNAALDQSTESQHEHFAVFQSAQDSQTYFIAFEDGRGMSPVEGYGDYNDVIFKLVTDDPPGENPPTNPVPEPATFTGLGLGLVGLGLLKRLRPNKGAEKA